MNTFEQTHFSQKNVAPSRMASSGASKSGKNIWKTLSFLLLGVLVIAGGVSAYLYKTSQDKIRQLQTPTGLQEWQKKEIESVVTKLRKITIIPADEEPVVADVVDPALLSTQSAFFENIARGDQVVLYPKAKRAYIYRPVDNVLVNSGPLLLTGENGQLLENSGVQTRPASASPTPLTTNEETVSVEFRNGTDISGKATTVSRSLPAGFTVSKVESASKKDYSQTLVINNGAEADQVATLAKQFNAKIESKLPSGEAQTEADILVIVGAN